MDINIVIDECIYLTYKEEIMKLNARLFKTPYFYDIKNYKVPFDLDGVKTFLMYADDVIIHSTMTFIDYVNILLILDFLKANHYKNKVTVKYYAIDNLPIDKAIISTKILNDGEYDMVTSMVDDLKNERPLNDIINLPGSIGFNNFYNMLVDSESFILCLDDIIDENDGDIDLISSYLENKYCNMGLDKNYYEDYLRKHMDNNENEF